jgi:hypothetical protein
MCTNENKLISPHFAFQNMQMMQVHGSTFLLLTRYLHLPSKKKKQAQGGVRASRRPDNQEDEKNFNRLPVRGEKSYETIP